MNAAEYLTEQGIDEADFEVSRIQITVEKNPGPTRTAPRSRTEGVMAGLLLLVSVIGSAR